MLKICHIIFNKVTWQVANGKEVRFSTDSWEGFPPICKIERLTKARTILSQAIGTFLANYWEEDLSTTKGWKWKNLEIYDIPEEDLSILKASLSMRSFNLSSAKDKLVWIRYHTREYNVKDGYKHLSKHKSNTLKLLPLYLC